MPILGIIASSFRSAAGPVGAYDSLASVTLSSDTASISFAGIPSGYKHLQLRIMARTTATGATDGGYMTMQFNGISTSAAYYGQHWLKGNGSTASAGADGTATTLYLERISTGQQTASVFGAGIIDILDYANTNKNKVTRQLIGYDNNGSGTIQFGSGMLLSTPAITSISISPNAGNFATYSSFALYGVK